MTGDSASLFSCLLIHSFTRLANNVLLIHTPISSREKAAYFLFYSVECASLGQNVTSKLNFVLLQSLMGPGLRRQDFEGFYTMFQEPENSLTPTPSCKAAY